MFYENKYNLKHGAIVQMNNMRRDGNRYEIFKMQKAAKGESVLLGKPDKKVQVALGLAVAGVDKLARKFKKKKKN